MVVIFSGKEKINFSEMEKFQWWIVGKDVEWAKHVAIFSLFNIYLNLIWPLVKEFLHAITRFNLDIIELVSKEFQFLS